MLHVNTLKLLFSSLNLLLCTTLWWVLNYESLIAVQAIVYQGGYGGEYGGTGTTTDFQR